MFTESSLKFADPDRQAEGVRFAQDMTRYV
jgi:hypothetical protein